MSKNDATLKPDFGDAIVLRTTNLSLGKIETNIGAVLEAVKERSRQYQDIAKYEGDDKQAKEDRALLRKQKDLTKTTIASIQEMWNEPLKEVLDGGKAIIKQFDLAIDTIDEWIKEGEAAEKEKKREVIQRYFDAKEFDLVPLEKIFDSKWLNKTYKLPDIKKEIDEAINSIYGNIKILENIAEHGMTAKAFYLDTLDMAAAMRQVETLKENAKRLAREQADREDREAKTQVSQNAIEERQEERAVEKTERVQSLAAEALGIEETKTDEPAKPQMLEYTLRFKGTEQQLRKLREYMTSQGIPYQKVMIFETDKEAGVFLNKEKIADGRIQSAFVYPISA